MKKCFFILLFITYFSGMEMPVMAQVTAFPEVWKYKEGDDSSYKNEELNDQQWQSVSVNKVHNPLTIQHPHTFGWFRVSFDLTTIETKQDLIFLLGTIDDDDETYLNGVWIGKTGKFPPGDEAAWDIQRNYLVKKELLKQHNVLAIRVFNAGADGGIAAGTGIYNPKLCYLSAERFTKLKQQLSRQKNSYQQLTTSNGLIAAVYNYKTDQIESVYPHIFTAYDSAKFVQPFAVNIHLKGGYKPINVRYLNNTHIIEVDYKNFKVDYFASFTNPEKILYAVLKGKVAIIQHISFQSEKGKGTLLSNASTGILKGDYKYFLFSFNDSLHQNTDVYNTALMRLRSSSNELISRELLFMKNLFSKCHFPAILNRQERNLAEQSVAILKMSQVSSKEIFPLSHGQILASLRPGNWAISWVRDASYSIEAMSALKMFTEARNGLEFMLLASPTNQFIHYIHTDQKDYGIKVPYQISVTRYFGNGREESDYGEDNGPNIELDDFGLFLTAFADYVTKSGDKDFYLKWNQLITQQVVHAILQNIGTDKLIRRESGPWEHHLPGRQFIFTSAVCSRGLAAIASLQKKYDLPSDYIERGSATLYDGIMQQFLINGKYFKGNVQDSHTVDHYYFDAASFEVFANGLIHDKNIFNSHMQAYNQVLRALLDSSKGYIRFNSNDSYENQEWPFAGLRVAMAQNYFGNKKEAKKLIDRITSLASGNYNQVPEIISLDLNRYKGSIPMVGYGSGVYILALMDYYQH